jgi:imidazolonepropionase-like amidohydrolase
MGVIMAENTIALIGGNLINGLQNTMIENSAIVIRGNTIDKVGNKKDIRLPSQCDVIDVSGQTVMPGLIDCHVHLCMGHLDTSPIGGFEVLPPSLSRPLSWFGIMSFAYARLALEMGFTTLRDVGDQSYSSVALRDIINSGIVEGPRILASGPALTTTGGHFDFLPLWLTRKDSLNYVVDGINECSQAVRRNVKMRTDWIKIFATGGIMDSWDKQEFNDEELAIIIKEAHSKGKFVCAHCMHPEGTLAAIKAGIDTVEHGSRLTTEIIELMLKNGTYLIPTLYAPHAIVNKGDEFGMSESYVENCRANVFEPHINSFRMAYKAGVKIAMGSDCGMRPCPHGSNSVELELMTKYCDMSAMDSIIAATRNSAMTLKLADKLGTIEPGKYADILVVNGDPLQDITILQDKSKISLVMRDGKTYVRK